MGLSRRIPAPQTLVDCLLSRATTHGDSLACAFLDGSGAVATQWDYAALDRRARTVAKALEVAGAADERALLLYPPGLEFVEAFLGCLYAGTVAVPSDLPRPREQRSRSAHLARDSEAAVLLTSSKVETRLEAHAPALHQLRSMKRIVTDRLTPAVNDDWHPCVADNKVAMLQYTSGSTAESKGVILTHANLYANASAIRDAFQFTEKSRVLSWLPHYHDMGLIGGIIVPLFAGVPTFLMSPLDFAARPLAWLLAISNLKATVSGAPNFAYDLCATRIQRDERRLLDLSTWEIAFSGSEPVRAETLERFSATFAPSGFHETSFLPCYGLAEATLLVSSGPKLRAPTISHIPQRTGKGSYPTSRPTRIVGCGRADAAGTSVVVDATGRACEPSEIGEIWLTGAGVAAGYWKRPRETEATFHARLAGDQREFLRTGDLGFIQGGELFVTGRLKDVIIVAGVNHQAAEIEQTVETAHPWLMPGRCAVFPVDWAGEERVVVAVELDRDDWVSVRPPVARAVRSRRSGRGLDQPGAVETVAWDSGVAVRGLVGEINASLSRDHGLRAYAVALAPPRGLPRTTSGKITRNQCREDFMAVFARHDGTRVLATHIVFLGRSSQHRGREWPIAARS